MSIEGQGHSFTIYFPGFVCFVLYLDKISDERLQDHWSSGLSFAESFVVEQQTLFGVDLIHNSMISDVKVQCLGRGVEAGLEV